MRYATLLVGLFVLAATRPCRAQQLQLGLKGGLMASTSKQPSSSTARLGGVAGGWLRYPVATRVGLQTELVYEQRGVKTTEEGQLGWEGSSGAYTRRERTRLHYVSLPLLVRGQVGKFFGLVGPQLSYLVAARQQARTEYILRPGTSPETSQEWLPYPVTETDRGTGDFRRWELGYTAGVGYQLGARLGLEVRYAAGLTKLHQPYTFTPERYEPASPLTSARNRTWQVQLSYQLSALKLAK
ncbi:hypothetical protein GCM10011375_40620 [Hymenobacter qilianensis]|uniref:Uncharacterized protein n=2 Tax=Hymenobacter qilianensis TaxID=1385715 RepID=A0ACB5PXB7_9BACT|nr:porin family protein [Hymenobacter qilianensis]QNP54468.1 PorT family protein [Hymenobacter qilianensis]GGF81537.1 hypothetical protein GCM10011375_40620 [Hymenobacter qilianensis]